MYITVHSFRRRPVRAKETSPGRDPTPHKKVHGVEWEGGSASSLYYRAGRPTRPTPTSGTSFQVAPRTSSFRASPASGSNRVRARNARQNIAQAGSPRTLAAPLGPEVASRTLLPPALSWLQSLPRVRKPAFSPWDDEAEEGKSQEKR